MKFDFLLAVAHPCESLGRFEELGRPICYTGLGKINACIALLSELNHFSTRGKAPKAVINLGTVGSGDETSGCVMQVVRFVQRDMLCTPLADEPYKTPLDIDDPGYIDVASIPNFLDPVICGSGDSFVNSDILKLQTGPKPPWSVVDMEGYALARVCRSLDIPFFSIKYVTDSGKVSDWEAMLDSASKTLATFALLIIERLKNIPEKQFRQN